MSPFFRGSVRPPRKHPRPWSLNPRLNPAIAKDGNGGHDARASVFGVGTREDITLPVHNGVYRDIADKTPRVVSAATPSSVHLDPAATETEEKEENEYQVTSESSSPPAVSPFSLAAGAEKAGLSSVIAPAKNEVDRLYTTLEKPLGEPREDEAVAFAPASSPVEVAEQIEATPTGATPVVKSAVDPRELSKFSPPKTESNGAPLDMGTAEITALHTPAIPSAEAPGAKDHLVPSVTATEAAPIVVEKPSTVIEEPLASRQGQTGTDDESAAEAPFVPDHRQTPPSSRKASQGSQSGASMAPTIVDRLGKPEAAAAATAGIEDGQVEQKSVDESVDNEEPLMSDEQLNVSDEFRPEVKMDLDEGHVAEKHV